MSRRIVAALALAMGLHAGEAADPAAAMRLPASGAALAAAAATWSGREDDLLRLLADPVPARRRGAARLAAALPVAGARLAAALAGCEDPEVRRLGAAGLRGVDLPIAAVVALRDPAVVAALAADHPSADPLADPALKALVGRWLADQATCVAAARLVAGRGSAASWGTTLVDLLASPSPPVVAAAHDALQILTRTQRSLAVYAGDRRLLAQDWRDTLAAARPAPGRPDPELMALVADLPAPAALAGLLAKGMPALAAIESAQASAGRQRRRELEPAARLITREVPAGLYQALGAAAFAGLDDPEPTARTACLRALVAQIRERKDADGLRHLLAWLDDADASVRATALDQLVRLSDEAKAFGDDWEVGDDKLFPPGRTLHRLRRCLREGQGDEQVAALLLIGTMRCSDLCDDVVSAVVSPRPEVALTALETLTRLEVPERHLPTLDRLAGQASLGRPGRLAVVKILGGMLGHSGRGANPVAIAPLIRLVGDPEMAVASAAVKALSDGRTPATVLRSALDRLVADGRTDSAISIAEGSQNAGLAPFLAGLVLAGGAAADRAAFALADRFDHWDDDARKEAKAVDTPALRASLSAALAAGAAPGRAVLAVSLGALPLHEALPQVAGADPALLGRSIGILASRAANPGEFASVAELAAGSTDAAHLRWERILGRAMHLAALAPTLIAEVVATDSGILGHVRDNTNFEDSAPKRTLTLEDGTTIRLQPKPVQPGSTTGTGDAGGEEADPPDRSEDTTWMLAGATPAGPDESQLAVLAGALGRLRPTDADDQRFRDLLIAWIMRREPAPALAEAWHEQSGLCRLLAARHPAFLAAVRGRFSASEHSSTYQLRGWLRGDDGSAAKAMIAALIEDDSPSDWELDPLIAAMQAMPAEHRNPLLAEALRIKGFNAKAGKLLASSGPLPLAAALAMCEDPAGGTAPFAPIAPDQAETIRARLAGWTPAQVLARAEAVRRLRAAGPAAVDGAVARLVAVQAPTTAAWLRTGIPLEAGMAEAYRQAETSAQPDVALVGAAFALKEQRLAPGQFLERTAGWPVEVQTAAMSAAQRYLAGRWDGLSAPAAALVGKLGTRALTAWIGVLPADPAVVDALAARVADAATADAIGGALLQRRSRDQAWAPAVQRIIPAAKGRLDWLNQPSAR